MRALEFGRVDQLRQKYGSLATLEDMPKDWITRPAIVFIPAPARKEQVVCWDASKALKLWQKRQSEVIGELPDVFEAEADIKGTPTNIVGRNRLVLMPKNAKEMLYYTTDDE